MIKTLLCVLALGMACALPVLIQLGVIYALFIFILWKSFSGNSKASNRDSCDTDSRSRVVPPGVTFTSESVINFNASYRDSTGTSSSSAPYRPMPAAAISSIYGNDQLIFNPGLYFAPPCARFTSGSVSNSNASNRDSSRTINSSDPSRPRPDAATSSRSRNNDSTTIYLRNPAVSPGVTTTSRNVINSITSNRDSSVASISSDSLRRRRVRRTLTSTNNGSTSIYPRSPAVSSVVTSSSRSVINSNTSNRDSNAASISSDSFRRRHQRSTLTFTNNDSTRIDSRSLALSSGVTSSSRSVINSNASNRDSSVATISSDSHRRRRVRRTLTNTNNGNTNIYPRSPGVSSGVTSSSRRVSDIGLSSNGDWKGMCIICMKSDIKTVFLPCKHTICCADCSPKFKCCPMCRGEISSRLNVYFP